MFLFEIIFEFLGEFVLQILFELFADGTGRALKQPLSRRYAAHPLLAVFVYALLGAALGGLSLLVLPNHLVRDPNLGLANLLLGPFAAGGAMHLLGRYLQRHRRGRTKLETFACGFAFALALRAVRFFFAGTR